LRNDGPLPKFQSGDPAKALRMIKFRARHSIFTDRYRLARATFMNFRFGRSSRTCHRKIRIAIVRFKNLLAGCARPKYFDAKR